MRLFIAVPVPGRLQDLLAREASAIAGCRGVKAVAPAGMHLTLAFIGERDASEVNRITEIMAEAACLAEPFEVTCGGVIAFPLRGHPRVAAVPCTGGVEQLGRMHYFLVDNLGLAEKNRFIPHITLARFARYDRDIEAQYRKLVRECTIRQRFAAESLVLYASELHPSGARYRKVSEQPLS